MDSEFRNFNDRAPDAFSLAAKSRKLHYSFAYKMLPLLAFGKYGQDVFDLLCDPDKSREYLMDVWERTADTQGLESFNPEGLGTSFSNLDGYDTVVVYLPEPLYPPEAYYVILQRDPSDQQIHFFTVELSVRMDGSKRVVLGKYQSGGGRHNLGALPSAQIENCLDEIARRRLQGFQVG